MIALSTVLFLPVPPVGTGDAVHLPSHPVVHHTRCLPETEERLLRKNEQVPSFLVCTIAPDMYHISVHQISYHSYHLYHLASGRRRSCEALPAKGRLPASCRGIGFPTMILAFRPYRLSVRPSMAACASTRPVS